MNDINFNASADDAALIERILDRAERLGDLDRCNRLNTEMDILACHLNGTSLRLADWLAADDFNFRHDLYGIDRHMDRQTGKLTGFFVPRFAVRQAA